MVRDSAKADADRAEARASDRSADLTPEIVKRFAGEAKRRLRTDAGDYRRHHLQALPSGSRSARTRSASPARARSSSAFWREREPAHRSEEWAIPEARAS